MTVTFTDEEIQRVLTTLAFAACDRPFLDAPLRSLAAKFGDDAVRVYETHKDSFRVSADQPAAASRRGRRR